MKKTLLLFLICSAFFGKKVQSQVFLNGDFETTTCPSFCTWGYINISNAFFTANMSNSFGFGPGESLDIMHTSCTWGPAQSGSYFIGLDYNVTDPIHNAFSMQLSTPLITGTNYTIAFADKGDPCCTPPGPVELTLSTVNNAIGTTIFVGPAPTVGVWNVRTFTFNAPNNGQFITVRPLSPGFWTNIDNFRFVTPLPVLEKLQFEAKNTERSTLLFWQLQDETDIKEYIIERSLAKNEFREINRVAATQSGFYQIADNEPYKGTAFYRIALLDKDGIFHHSKSIEVSRNDEYKYLKAYPNPAQNNITVETPFEKAELAIVDGQGKVYQIQNATFYQNVDISVLSKGSYIVTIYVAKSILWLRLIFRRF